MSDKIKLGVRVKDIVTGFEGIAVERCMFLDGTVSIGIRARSDKGEYEMPKTNYISEAYLQVIDEGIHVAPVTQAIGFKSEEAA